MLQYNPSITGSLTITGSLIVSGNISSSGSITISGSVASASYAASLQGLGSASFAPAGTFNTVSQSYATTSGSLSTRVTTNETNITTLTSASASFAAQSASLSIRLTTDESNYTSLSSSFATESGSISGRVTTIESKYATTGSNTFTNLQYISATTNAAGFNTSASLYTDGGLRVSKDSFVSGTAYFTNVVVYGTSSIQYITSSQVVVGANMINLNTQTPAVRFGGIAVADSGSNAGITGSLLWDSVYNRWIYSNPSGSTYDGGMLISGPKNTSGLGNELGTTACYLIAGQGGDHITSSAIYTDTNCTAFYSTNLFITSSGYVGINTITPEHTLHVKADCVGTIATVAQFQNVNCTCTNKSFIRVRGQNTLSTSYSAYFGIGQDTNLYIYGNDPSRAGDIVVTAAGLVGINTCTPSYRLDVNGTGQFTSDADCKPVRLINGTISGGSTSGITGLYIGDVGSGINMIQREKQTANTAAVVLYSEYGYSTQSKVAFLNRSGVVLYTADTCRLYIDSNGVSCFSSAVCAPNYIASSTCSTAGLRMYGGSGAHQWDMYLNGNNIRFSDNTAGAGCFVVDTIATFGGKIGVAGASATYPLTVYNGSNGTTAAFGGTTYGIRIDNDGTFSCGRSTIYGVDTSFYGSYQPLAIGASALYLNISGTDKVTLTSGAATFANTVCSPGLYVGGALASSGDAGAITLKQTSTTAATGIYLERSGEQKGYYMYVGGAVDSLTFQRNNAGTKADVLSLTRDGISCFASTVCTPLIRASRVISNNTQIFDSDFSLNTSTSRTVVLCGGIYTLGDFHIMAYGNAGTGMAILRLTTGGYFANSNLLHFCELQRYTFNTLCISSVSNNGTSLSFNIANCSGTYGAAGIWRMISVNGDAANNCIQVYVL